MSRSTEPTSDVPSPDANFGETRSPSSASTVGHRYRVAARSLGPGVWIRMLAWTVVVGAAIAIPARLVPNSFFTRMTPTRPQDYVFWILGAALTGAVLSLRRVGANKDTRGMSGGLATFLAVGCPVCNKLVVALIGAGGATSVFAPVQPLIGIAALGLLAWALRTQLRAMANPMCEVVLR